jgi:hypothetical protein
VDTRHEAPSRVVRPIHARGITRAADHRAMAIAGVRLVDVGILWLLIAVIPRREELKPTHVLDLHWGVAPFRCQESPRGDDLTRGGVTAFRPFPHCSTIAPPRRQWGSSLTVAYDPPDCAWD